VLMISLTTVIAGTWLLLLTEGRELSATLFEVVSAFSTTGLSVGLTPELKTPGRLIVIALMFWGRLGAVTIMLVLLKKDARKTLVKYPEETVLVG
jgi:trk system potassium uptake protein TrkH